MIGQVIGNYRLVSELGKGGMGVVYVAEHTQLGRPAALKMLLPQFSSDEAIVQRFFNEARAASAIDHPGIVEIFEFGKHTDGRAYIVMALLKGETLQERLVREPLTPVEGATIVAQVASALSVAHARGIVHRDLKPDNIFLVPNEMMPCGVQAKLLDFGIAKLADERASFKTQTGSLIGTPAYMSPEQCMGRSDLDHRTDLYALGCILFHVLCGRPPFISEAGAGPMIAAHLRDPAPDPRTFNPYVTEPLARIVLRLLEKDPAARIQTAAELREALMLAGANVSLTRPMAATQPTTGPRTAAYRGPEAYHATTAPTTNSGSAAQRVAPPTKPGKTGRWLALAGLVLVLGGIVTYVALAARSDAPPRVAQQPAPPEPPPPLPPTQPIVIDAAIERAELDPCTQGQVRNDDTRGHCCWAEQAWSTSKSACIGTPRCPDGMHAKGTSCVEGKSTAETPPQQTGEARFTLDKQVYAPGEAVTFKFAAPVPSAGVRKAWVTLVEEGKPDTFYSGWTFVVDGARSAELRAPPAPGNYEARVHTEYSTKSFNLKHRVPFEVKAAAPVDIEVTPLAKQRFALDKHSFTPREDVLVAFPSPMRASKGERFWVTIVKSDANVDSYGEYEYVPDRATKLHLRAPGAAGAYEVRLHANYPTKTTNVVFRAPITVVR